MKLHINFETDITNCRNCPLCTRTCDLSNQLYCRATRKLIKTDYFSEEYSRKEQVEDFCPFVEVKGMKTYFIVEAFHDSGIFQVASRETFEEAQDFLINYETHSWYGKGSGRINEYDQDMHIHKSYTFRNGVFTEGYDRDKKEPIRIVAIKQE